MTGSIRTQAQGAYARTALQLPQSILDEADALAELGVFESRSAVLRRWLEDGRKLWRATDDRLRRERLRDELIAEAAAARP